MSRVLVFAVLACLTTGCATIDYVGDTYQPTTHVDLYFSEAEVPRDYRVIGQVRATGDQFVTASGLHAKMMLRAREKGADGVIILDITRRLLSDEKRVVETTKESGDEKDKTTEKTVSVSHPGAEGSEIRALFIKYR